MKLPHTLIGRHPSWNLRPLFFWLLLAFTLLSAIGAEKPQRDANSGANAPSQQQASVAAPLPETLTFAQITDMHLFDEGKKRDNREDFDRDQRDNRDALHWAVERINDLVNHGRNIDFVVFTGDFGLEFVRDADERAPCGDVGKAPEKQDQAFKKYKGKGWPRYIPIKDAADDVASEFRRLRVSTIYVLPGNNDLVDEDPCDIDRYDRFFAQLAKAMPGNPTSAVNLIKASVDVKGFVLVGLNSASFKKVTEKDEPEEKERDRKNKDRKNNAADQIKQVGQSIAVPEKPPGSLYLIFTHIPDLDDPYTLDSAWYSEIDRDAWNDIVASPDVAGVFAGHFHSYERRLYASPGQKTQYDKRVANKTWVAPPLAMKAQDDKPETARGFLLVQVQKSASTVTTLATGKTPATVAISATPFWYEGPRRGMCWCYVLPVLSVLAVLAILIWGIYGYATAKARHPERVRETYPTLLTMVGLAVIALLVRKAMRFMIADLNLPPMYWEVSFFGAIGGIFGSLAEQGSFVLARYEDPNSIKAGILSDIVAGIGGAIAVVFVSERTLLLEAGKTDSLLSLASVSFIAGAAGRKLVQLAVDRFLKQLEERKKTTSGEQPQAESSKDPAHPPSGVQAPDKKSGGSDGGPLLG